MAEGDREIARDTVRTSLGSPSFAATVAAPGYSGDEIAEVSDRLVDDVVAHGDPTTIAATVRDHLAAGADHVELMLPIGDFPGGTNQFERLAPWLVSIE